MSRAERCLQLARVHLARGDAEGCEARLDEGLALVRGPNDPVEVGLLIVRAQLIAWRYDATQSLAAARRAAAVARRAGVGEASAQLVLGQAFFVAGSRACLRSYESARRAAAGARELELELEAWAMRTGALQAFGHSRAALRSAEYLRQSAAERRKPIWADLAAWYSARIRWLAFGDAPTAARQLKPLLGKRTLGLHRPQLLADFALALAETGDLETARQLIRQASLNANTHWTTGVAAFYSAEIEWASGRPGRAVAAADQALRRGLPSPVDLMARTTRLWSLYELGRPEADLDPMSPIPMLAGAMHENRAFAALCAGHADEAERCFRTAAEAWRENVMRHSLRAAWAAANLTLLLGRPSRARQELVRLEEEAAVLGQEAVLARIRRTLRRFETRNGSARGSYPSAREIEILAHVAGGASTREIADRLDISRKTVDSHINNVMAKLGAATRFHATVLAGLTPRRPHQDDDASLLFELLGQGVSITEAARRLGLSRRTATRRLQQARAELNVRDTAANET